MCIPSTVWAPFHPKKQRPFPTKKAFGQLPVKEGDRVEESGEAGCCF